MIFYRTLVIFYIFLSRIYLIKDNLHFVLKKCGKQECRKGRKNPPLSNVRNFVFNGSRGMNHPLNNYLKIRNFGEIDKFFEYYLQRFFGIIESKSCR